MQNIATKTIREIAVASPATTRVFEEYRIDYCCHGDRPFDDACREAGAIPEIVSEKIDAILACEADVKPNGYEAAALYQLIDYILDKHHVYTKQELKQLTPLMDKVVRKHGDHHPALFELQELYDDTCDDLGPHMLKEENVLFPYISRLESDVLSHVQGTPPPFGTVLNPVRMMRIEHDKVGDLLAKMRFVTEDYTLPEWGCPSFRALYHRLGELERDLHQHIHLENNILFPRAIDLEEKAFALVAA